MKYLVAWLSVTGAELVDRWTHRTSAVKQLPPPTSNVPALRTPTVDPEGVLWRPPPREALLRKQRTAAIASSTPSPSRSRSAPRRGTTRLDSDIPAANAPPRPTPQPYQWPEDTDAGSRVSRRRQGLESLVNLRTPVEHEGNHDAS